MAPDIDKKSSCPVHLDEIIFALTFLVAFALLQLPYEKINSNTPVPKIIFKNKPSLFHAFLLALNFAFTGAVMAICTRRGYPPKMANISRGLSVVSAATALAILAFSVLR